MDSLFDSSILQFSGDLETHATVDMFGNAQVLAFNASADADVSAHFRLAQPEQILFSYNFADNLGMEHSSNGRLTITRDSDGQMVNIPLGESMLKAGSYKLSFNAFAGPFASSVQFEPLQAHYDVAMKFGEANAIPLPAGGWTGLAMLTLLGAGFGLRAIRVRRAGPAA